MPGFLKCTCEHCGGRIEYPAEAVGANVACPHCQQETPLKLDSDDGADVIAVGGGKAKVVIGTVIASVVAVAVLAGALVWAKRKTALKDSLAATTPSQKAGKVVAAPPANPSARVELDLPKAVVPVVAKFQNGLTGAQIKNGRALFGGACTECHRQYDPATYGATEWAKTIGAMRGKAKLRGREGEDLDTFVRAVRN
ncbi:MAG: hypothetical protein ABMA26_23815 [Limisphaerales bacterium]